MGLSVHTTGSNVGYWFGTQSRVEQCCAGAPTPSAAHTDNFNAITSSPFGLIGLCAIVPPEHLRDICLSLLDLDSSPSSGRPSGHPPVLDIVPDTLRTPLRSLRLSRRHPLSTLLLVTSGTIIAPCNLWSYPEATRFTVLRAFRHLLGFRSLDRSSQEAN